MAFVQGKVRENQEFSKIVGVFEATVLSINPTKDELELIYGPQDKDPEYVKEKEIKLNEEGDTAMVDSVRVDVYLKDKKTGQILKAVFFLEDRDKGNKAGTKYQYINAGGTTSWAEDESDLQPWFAAKEYRKAKVGEEEFYGFCKAWLKYDFRKPDTNFDLSEFNNMIKGDLSSIKGEINGEAAQTVVGLATIRTVEKDGEVKQYQGVYNRLFLPGYNMKFFKTKKFSPEIIDELRQKPTKETKPFEKFVLQITDDEHGVKDYFVLEEVRPFEENENVIAGDNVLIEDDNSDY